MLHSMTAFGRSSLITPFGRLEVEIKSVNRKHLEIISMIPETMHTFDILLRRWLMKSLERGYVTLRVFFFPEESASLDAIPHYSLAKAYQKAWEGLHSHLSIPFSQENFLSFLSHQKDLFEIKTNFSDEEFVPHLERAVHLALESHLSMREIEGRKMGEDIEARLAELRNLLKKIPPLAEKHLSDYQAELHEKMSDLLDKADVDQDRLMQEVYHLAEKGDISEELTRFASHLDQFSDKLASSEKSCGKTLVFLVQELSREANTMSVKSSTSEIIHLVIQMKQELERIREQLMNVE